MPLDQARVLGNAFGIPLLRDLGHFLLTKFSKQSILIAEIVVARAASLGPYLGSLVEDRLSLFVDKICNLC